MMSDFFETQTQYNAVAASYNSLEDVSGERLAAALVQSALSAIPIRGRRVLDLGGGDGKYARLAIDLGAEHVTCIDLSPGMVEVGRKIQAENSERGGRGKITYAAADCSKDLGAQLGTIVELVESSFDVVMANWMLNHAETAEQLRGMWTNIAKYVKPVNDGGCFIGLINHDAYAKSCLSGTYGTKYEDHRKVGDAVKYTLRCVGDKAVQFNGCALRRELMESVPREAGMAGLELQEADEALAESVIAEPLGFWKEFSESPYFVLGKAVKNA